MSPGLQPPSDSHKWTKLERSHCTIVVLWYHLAPGKSNAFSNLYKYWWVLWFSHCLSWICLRQVEPSTILSGTSPRVNQGILLSLVLQLSSELAKDTGHKLRWIKEAALALNPDDPHLGIYMRHCLEQAYQNCHCLMGVTTVPSEQANLRLVIHLMNSLLSSCKWQPLMICHTNRSRVSLRSITSLNQLGRYHGLTIHAITGST